MPILTIDFWKVLILSWSWVVWGFSGPDLRRHQESFGPTRNLLGGHIISALIGVFAYKLLYPHIWLAAALGVATSIAVMHTTRTLHPPGGATALIAVVGGQKGSLT